MDQIDSNVGGPNDDPQNKGGDQDKQEKEEPKSPRAPDYISNQGAKAILEWKDEQLAKKLEMLQLK